MGTWIAALCTLGLMSFAIRDNIYYRIAEYTFVAITMARGFVLTIELFNPVIITPMKNGHIEFIIPIALGLLVYSRFFKGKSWLMGYPISILIGVGVGLSLKGIVSAQIIRQVTDTYSNINSIGGLLINVGVVSVLLYFFFSRKEAGKTSAILNVTNKIGRVFMMIAFGAMFGNTVIGRMSLLLGRLKFLLGDWLHIIG